MKRLIKSELRTAFSAKVKPQPNKTETFKFRAKQIHGDRYDYSRSEFKNAHSKIEVICHHHGSFYTTQNLHITYKTNCPYCSRGRFTPEYFLKEVNRIHGDIYSYPDANLIQFVKSMGIIKIECQVHGVFYQRLDVHLIGHGCPECSGRPYNHGNEAIYKTQRLAYLGE